MTSPQRWQEIDRIFAVALEREPHQRAAFLDEACAGDELLRKEVDSLLANDIPESLVGVHAVQEARRLLEQRAAHISIHPNTRLGRYEIRSQLGSGAMGEVYLARDPKINRDVAIKVLPAAFSSDSGRLRRFEQVRGQQVDHRSDIFSLGVILYEMLSGRRAFRGESAIETLNAILKEDPPGLSENNGQINPALERVVMHCLEKSPPQRFQSARDVGFALEALSGLPSTHTLPTALPLTAGLSRNRERMAWIIAGVLLLGLTIAYLRRRRWVDRFRSSLRRSGGSKI